MNGTRPAAPFDALLCDLDNVVRFYELDEVERLERAAGFAPGTTAEIAHARERDPPLLPVRIGRAEWADSVAEAPAALVPAARAAELAAAFARAPSRVERQVVELLRRARRAVPLVLVTNTAVRLDEDLAHLGVADLTDHVVGSSRLHLAEPDPRSTGSPPASRASPPTAAPSSTTADDSRTNTEAARRAGMTAVHHRDVSVLRRLAAPVLAGTAAPAAR